MLLNGLWSGAELCYCCTVFDDILSGFRRNEKCSWHVLGLASPLDWSANRGKDTTSSCLIWVILVQLEWLSAVCARGSAGGFGKLLIQSEQFVRGSRGQNWRPRWPSSEAIASLSGLELNLSCSLSFFFLFHVVIQLNEKAKLTFFIDSPKRTSYHSSPQRKKLTQFFSCLLPPEKTLCWVSGDGIKCLISISLHSIDFWIFIVGACALLWPNMFCCSSQTCF